MNPNPGLINQPRLRRTFAFGVVFLIAGLLPTTAARAEVTSEILITDKSYPSSPAGSEIALYDLGDGGECARAYKVIGKVVIRMKAPLDAKMIGDKITEAEPELRRAGASGVMITDFTINKYGANGYVDAATLVYTVIRYTDEPRVDLRSETDFKALLRAKDKPAPIEGIWVDQATAERVAFFEDPAQKGRYLGVQFDVGNETHVPKGLIVADLRLEADGWLVGHVMFDDFTRHQTKFKMRTGDEFKIPVKICSNSYFARSYPDKFPPEYRLLNVTYVRQPLK
jgi:hypothetical protein